MLPYDLKEDHIRDISGKRAERDPQPAREPYFLPRHGDRCGNGKPGSGVGKLDIVFARPAFNGDKAVGNAQHLALRAVDSRRPAVRLIRNAEQNDIRLIQRYLRIEAVARIIKFRAAHLAAFEHGGLIGFLARSRLGGVRVDACHELRIIIHLFIRNDDIFAEHRMPLIGDIRTLEIRFRHEFGISKAHRQEVFVFVNIVIVLRIDIGKSERIVLALVNRLAVDRLFRELIIPGADKGILRRGKAAYAVIAAERARADITRDADLRIKFHDRGRHDGVEADYVRVIPVNTQIIHRGYLAAAVEIQAVKAGMRVGKVHLPVYALIHHKAAVVRIHFAVGDMYAAVKHRHTGNTNKQRAGEKLCPAVAAEDHCSEGDPRKGKRDIDPEPERIRRVAELVFRLICRVEIPYQPEPRRDKRAKHRVDGKWNAPPRALIIQRDDRRQRKDHDEHIQPAGVKAGIEEIKQAVCNREEGHERQNDGKRFQPSALLHAEKRHDTAHRNEREIHGNGSPARFVAIEEVHARGDIRREDIGFEKLPVTLPIGLVAVAVNKQLYKVRFCRLEIAAEQPLEHFGDNAGVGALDTRIAHERRRAGKEDEHGHHKPEHRFEEQAAELAQADIKCARGGTEEEIKYAEYDLPREHEVVYHRVQAHGNGKQPLAVVLDIFLHADKQKREERHDIVELVEEGVVYLESGECIKHRADNGVILVAHKALQISIRKHGGNDVFYNVHRCHEIRCPGCGEKAKQPVKRAADHVI